MDENQALNNPEFNRLHIVAADLGMGVQDIGAFARVRHRLLVAVWLCQESLPGAPPDENVRVFEAIDRQTDAREPHCGLRHPSLFDTVCFDVYGGERCGWTF